MPFFSTNSLKSFTRRCGVTSAGATAGTISRIAVASELLEFHGFHCEELDCGGFHWDELDADNEEELDCTAEGLEETAEELEEVADELCLATPDAANDGA